MWKKIIIGSVVLFVASSYLYFANNDGMTAANGELAFLQQNFRDAAEKSKDMNIDRYVKLYAEMRTEEFNRLKEKYAAEKSELDAESSSVREEITQLQTTCETADADYKRLKDELNALLNEAATTAKIDSADGADVMRDVAEKIANLIAANEELEKLVAQEEALIATLGSKSEELQKLIAAGKKLNQDRQARISPPELSCSVLTTDPQWDYVILDAGVDKGIVIGSRLAVMRGEEKICELNVTLVESTRASCDVVYSTLKAGERVQVGDKVISAKNQ